MKIISNNRQSFFLPLGDTIVNSKKCLEKIAQSHHILKIIFSKIAIQKNYKVPKSFTFLSFSCIQIWLNLLMDDYLYIYLIKLKKKGKTSVEWVFDFGILTKIRCIKDFFKIIIHIPIFEFWNFKKTPRFRSWKVVINGYEPRVRV